MGLNVSILEENAIEGESPLLSLRVLYVRRAVLESRSLGLERKVGGSIHLKLNICSKPIANKYHEGKVKRTLKRELKVPELAEGEANAPCFALQDCSKPGTRQRNCHG